MKRTLKIILIVILSLLLLLCLLFVINDKQTEHKVTAKTNSSVAPFEENVVSEGSAYWFGQASSINYSRQGNYVIKQSDEFLSFTFSWVFSFPSMSDYVLNLIFVSGEQRFFIFDILTHYPLSIFSSSSLIICKDRYGVVVEDFQSRFFVVDSSFGNFLISDFSNFVSFPERGFIELSAEFVFLNNEKNLNSLLFIASNISDIPIVVYSPKGVAYSVHLNYLLTIRERLGFLININVIFCNVQGDIYNDNSIRYKPLDVVSFTATPYSGFVFIGWYEDGMLISSNKTYEFTVERSYNLVAYAELPTIKPIEPPQGSKDIYSIFNPVVGIISLIVGVISPVFSLEIFPYITIGLIILTSLMLFVLVFVLRGKE